MLTRRTLLASAAAVSLAGGGKALAARKARKVIFDTDPGIDDVMALLFLQAAPDVELMGIVSASGNGTIETTTRNALYLAEKFHLNVPVCKGEGPSLLGVTHAPPTYVHGMNALGDIPLPKHIAKRLDPRPGWKLIGDTIRQHPGEVTVIAVGHMTNVALALRHDPGIAKLAKEIIIMGGSVGVHGVLGNVTPAAEANIIGDPQAADEVLGAQWPVTMVGLDVTTKTQMDDAYLHDLAQNCGEVGRFIWDTTRCYMKFHRSLGLNAIYVHDASAVAYFLDPTLFTTRSGPIRAVSGGLADGETIQKPDTQKAPPSSWDSRPSQKACIDVDSERLKALFRQTLMRRA